MKMPEGWKESKEILNRRGFAPDGIPHDSELYLIDQGLDLMKEMAEALDATEKRMQVWHDLSNLKREVPVYQQEYLDILNLNKKFKEWK